MNRPLTQVLKKYVSSDTVMTAVLASRFQENRKNPDTRYSASGLTACSPEYDSTEMALGNLDTFDLRRILYFLLVGVRTEA
jgi:hypothetical protein